jgi:Putative peptidoglycan binding domain
MKNTLKAAIFALALTVTVGASAEGYMFNNNLKMGARGADVSALQAVLVSGGYLAVSPTGYFGSMTVKAVKAYQLAKGIAPVSGFVGPLTRASLNVTSPVVVNPTNPTTPTTPVLSGSEGFAEVRLSPTPTNNTNIQTSSDVAVYGVEFKAKQSDISVERINLEVSVYNAGYENPSTLINKITVRDGSTVLTTIPVNSSTFSKASSTSNSYYVQITGISTKVAKDTTKTLTVSFDTNSIDTDRAVVVGIYGGATGQGIRTVDGRGISSYNGLGDTRAHTFKKPGNSNLLVKSDATTIYSQNYRINTTSNGAEKVLLSTFAVKSETGPSKIVSITATTTASGTNPSNLYLYDGSTLIDARSVSGTSVTFDINNSNINVAQDQTKTFTIKADMPATTATGTLVSATVTGVTYEKANGSSVTVVASIAGPYHYFAPVVPQFSKISSTATTVKNNNIDTSVTANVKLGVVAQGGDISATSSFSAIVGIKNIATGATVATSSVSGVVESGQTLFADGASKTIEFTANFASSSFSAGTTNVKTFVQSITFKPFASNVPATLTAGFELLDSDGYASFSK